MRRRALDGHRATAMRGVRKTLELTGLGLLVVVGSAVLTKAYELKYATPHGHDAAFWYQTIGAGAFWLAVAGALLLSLLRSIAHRLGLVPRRCGEPEP